MRTEYTAHLNFFWCFRDIYWFLWLKLMLVLLLLLLGLAFHLLKGDIVVSKP
jgi:hypothetical protein